MSSLPVDGTARAHENRRHCSRPDFAPCLPGVTIFAIIEMSREKISIVRVGFSQSKRIEMGLKGIEMS